jgi:hypothetical protein
MLETLNGLFSSEGFLPHGHCFLWTPGILWTYVISDSVIALAYYSIPVALWTFLSRRRDLPFPGLAVLFGIFIFACGTTHVMSVIDIWTPLYWLDASIKGVTATVSLVTAVLLWFLLPDLLSIPSRTDLESTN